MGSPFTARRFIEPGAFALPGQREANPGWNPVPVFRHQIRCSKWYHLGNANSGAATPFVIIHTHTLDSPWERVFKIE